MSLNFQILPLIAMLSLLSACGKPSSDNEGQREHRWIEESVVDAVNQIKNGAYLETCDRQNLAFMQEIAQILDDKQEAIRAYTQSRPNDSEIFKYVQVGPLTVRETLPGNIPKPDWQFDDYGWSVVKDYWTRNRDRMSLKEWAQLDTWVRGILADDIERVVEGSEFAVGYNDKSRLERIKTAALICRGSKDCLYPSFDPEDSVWMNRQRTYQYPLSLAWRANQTPEGKAEAMTSLIEYLDSDLYGYFGMRKNPEVKRNGDKLTLPVFTMDFPGDSKDQIARYVEQVWSKAGLALKMDWVDSSRFNNNIFNIHAVPGANGRSYVSYNQKLVMLYNNIKANSIAHEFGHVLGFRDRYYSVWNKETCLYQDQYREDDIMSDSTKAKVQPDEWEILEKTYP